MVRTKADSSSTRVSASKAPRKVTSSGGGSSGASPCRSGSSKDKLSKIWSATEKAQCVSWFIETKSDTQVQRHFRTQYGREPPSRPSIRSWHQSFMSTGNVLHRKGAGRPSTSEDDINRIRQAFTRSPDKSIRTVAKQLNIPTTTIHRVLHKRLHLYAYKDQLLQALKPSDKPQRRDF